MTGSEVTIKLTRAQVDRVVRQASQGTDVAGRLRPLSSAGAHSSAYRQLAESPRLSRSLLLGLLVLGSFPADGQRDGRDRCRRAPADEPEHDAPLPEHAARRRPARAGPALAPLPPAARRGLAALSSGGVDAGLTARACARRRGPPTRRRGRRTRAPRAPRRGARGSPPLSSRPTSFSSPRSPAGQLVVAALAAQREHLDRPRADAGDRAQPPPAALVLGRRAGRRARARPRARRARARARGAPARSKDSAAPARCPPAPPPPAGRAAPLRAPSPPAQRRPSARDHAALDRGRALVLDQLLADRPGERLERLRAAADAQPRPPPQRARRSADRARSGAGSRRRSSSTPSAKRIRSMPCAAASRVAARAPNSTAPRRGCATRTTHRLARRGAAAARARRRGGAACRPRRQRGSRNGAGGRDLHAQLDAAGAQRVASAIAAAAAEQVHVDEQRAAADDLQQLAALAPPRRADAAPARGPCASARRAALAAVHEPDDRGAGDEAAGRDRRGLHGREHRAGAARARGHARPRARAARSALASASSTSSVRRPARPSLVRSRWLRARSPGQV